MLTNFGGAIVWFILTETNKYGRKMHFCVTVFSYFEVAVHFLLAYQSMTALYEEGIYTGFYAPGLITALCCWLPLGIAGTVWFVKNGLHWKDAVGLDDHAVSILDRIRDQDYSITLAERERLGFVFPTYFYGLPSIVSEFLKKVSGDSRDHYVWLVASFGTSPGAVPAFAKKYLKGSGISVHAFYSIRMPDTWTPEFDLSDKEAVKRINEAEPAQIDHIAEMILKNSVGNFMEYQHSFLVSKICHIVYDHSVRKTKHFHVEDSCIGCGLCAKKCPVQAIEMKDGRPVWVKDRCVMCAGCLHRCPKFAIQFENKTKNHGQYAHPGVRSRPG